MKYTAEELVKYVFEEEQETNLFTAIMNNKEGYRVMPVKGKAEITEGRTQFVFEDLGLELEPYVFSEEELEAFGASIVEEPENVSACLILYDERVQVAIDYCNGNNDQKRDSMWSMIFADLFRQLGIDTLGKLRKFIEKGLNNQLAYNELDKQKLKLFGGKI